MIFKKILPFIFFLLSTFIYAEEPVAKLKIYGFVRNDFYFNSRINTESIDGLFFLYPKPVSLNSSGIDTNAVPQAEMLSVNTRIGVDLTGSPILGASSSAKIETDFAGFGSSYYVLRIRQAYFALNWKNTELMVGQTWHPLYGNVIPTVLDCNAGAPFQPNNRSPQIKVVQNINKHFSVIAAAVYEMQYLSQGPLGASNIYLKNALVPDLYVGTECKTTHWTSGLGLDVKTIKPSTEEITSVSATVYSQYINQKFQLKVKSFWGENLTDQQMLSGYGVSGINPTNGAATYTNFNIISSWLNAVYGKKWQVGAYLGLSQNLGTNHSLLANADGSFTAYGNGYSNDSQLLLDRLFRISPNISYNLPNFNVGLEYDFTSASYGKLQSNGLVSNPYQVNNHRIVAEASYFF
ncbi:MAG: hypothetical protein P4L34_01845 [Paludibacter sp.]|nr:hypothetical protein [Paludibacter sp.]